MNIRILKNHKIKDFIIEIGQDLDHQDIKIIRIKTDNTKIDMRQMKEIITDQNQIMILKSQINLPYF